jgi:hypothetical protein
MGRDTREHWDGRSPGEIGCLVGERAEQASVEGWGKGRHRHRTKQPVDVGRRKGRLALDPIR